MLIDIILLICLVLSLIKGYQKGLVLASFSFVGIFLGLAAAVKFSALVAGWLKEYTHGAIGWLPFIAFIIILIAVWILVRIGSKIIETSLELVMLGWVNRLAGIILYALIYATVLSIVLFYANQLHLLKPYMISDSKSYSLIQPLGPKFMEFFGKLLPAFKEAFNELTAFFEGLNK
jgi:membrane protein required for colicin V production